MNITDQNSFLRIGEPAVSEQGEDAPIDVRHLKVALAALAYLLAFNQITRSPSVFDDERNDALLAIRGYLESKGAL